MWADLPNWKIDLYAECDRVAADLNAIEDIEATLYPSHDPNYLEFSLSGRIELEQNDCPRRSYYSMLKMLASEIRNWREKWDA